MVEYGFTELFLFRRDQRIVGMKWYLVPLSAIELLISEKYFNGKYSTLDVFTYD